MIFRASDARLDKSCASKLAEALVPKKTIGAAAGIGDVRQELAEAEAEEEVDEE